MSVDQLIEIPAGALNSAKAVVVQNLRNVLLALRRLLVQRTIGEDQAERIHEPPRLRLQLPSLALDLLHRRLVSLERLQVVGGVPSKPLDDRFRFRSVVDPDEQIIFDKVNRLLRLGVALSGNVKHFERRVASLGRRLSSLPRGKPLFNRREQRVGLLLPARDVDRHRERSLLPFAFNQRQTHLSVRDALQIVVRQPKLPLDRAEVLANLLLEVIDERLHHVVVEHLPELGLVPAIVELFRSRDRDVALRRLGQQSIAGRASRSGCDQHELENDRERRRAANETKCRRQGGTSGTRHADWGVEVRRVMTGANSTRRTYSLSSAHSATNRPALGMSAETTGRDNPRPAL